MLNRRRHQRLPVIKDVSREITISVEKDFFPGVILNLSAGGMLLLAYSHIPENTEVCLALDLPSLEIKQVFGKVVRTKPKSIMWELGIQFTQIDTLDSKKINRIAIDFLDCENKIALGAQDVCKKACSYYILCDKKLKIK